MCSATLPFLQELLDLRERLPTFEVLTKLRVARRSSGVALADVGPQVELPPREAGGARWHRRIPKDLETGHAPSRALARIMAAREDDDDADSL